MYWKLKHYRYARMFSMSRRECWKQCWTLYIPEAIALLLLVSGIVTLLWWEK